MYMQAKVMLLAAVDMQAYSTVLTHFSQRYPGMIDVDLDVLAARRCLVAFDGLCCGMTELSSPGPALQAWSHALDWARLRGVNGSGAAAGGRDNELGEESAKRPGRPSKRPRKEHRRHRQEIDRGGMPNAAVSVDESPCEGNGESGTACSSAQPPAEAVESPLQERGCVHRGPVEIGSHPVPPPSAAKNTHIFFD
jgi:hypothetical protein